MNTTDIILTFLDTPRLWSASRKDSCGCPECMHLHQTGNTPEEALTNLLDEELERQIEREDVEPVRFMEGAPMSIDYSGLPQSLEGGVQRYIEHGIEPGRFLRAVIRNDLREALGYADDFNRERLFSIVSWFHSEAPAQCWGSVENMHCWIATRAKERE